MSTIEIAVLLIHLSVWLYDNRLHSKPLEIGHHLAAV